ncbi:MAG TPA: heme o synthase [Gaiellaceae bacterium]|nr:heme o synthase [Gaiellaceae bacterium]
MSSLALGRPVAVAPGVWLRASAIAATAATLLAVTSGAFGFGPAHRVLAALAAPPLVALVAVAWSAHRRLLPASLGAGALFGATAVLPASAAHVPLASLACAASVVLCVQAFRGEPCTAGRWRDYVTLTKPRIMSLLLVTGACGMVAGEGGLPSAGRFGATMLGLALACGGASALNHLLDRDIDRLMGKRTERRPVAAGRLSPAQALEFGLALSAFSFVLLAGAVNLLSAALALLGNLFYVGVYTRWLKRSTPQNIVIGGAAGAVPPLVGFAAGSGHLTIAAFWLFLIVFLWTPPHFWALALLLKDQYAAASVPMLPVARGERATLRQIVGYTFVLVAVTIVPAVVGTFGLVYLGGALALGGAFLVLALRLARRPSRPRAALLFHGSLLYLALLFAAVAVDTLL